VHAGFDFLVGSAGDLPSPLRELEARLVGFGRHDRPYRIEERVGSEYFEKLFSAVTQPGTHGALVGGDDRGNLTHFDPFQVM
jgi:hypothetical protein